jgi:hypothetical protein
MFLTGCLALLGAVACQRDRSPEPQERSLPASTAIHGDPIDATAATNAAADVRAPDATPKKHPKPASFPVRMVQYQAGRQDGSSSDPMPAFAAKPARIFSQAEVDAMSDDSIPAHYRRISFKTLSDFPFEVSRAMADGPALPGGKIPDAVRALDNQEVAIRGFLLPLKMDNGLTVEFLLLRNQSMCCFGVPPKINEWIEVETPGKGVKPIMDQPLLVMGKLNVGEIRENGSLAGIYKLSAENIIGP